MMRPWRAAPVPPSPVVDLRRRSMRRGFTLTEMIIVLAIVVLLVTLVLPAVNSMWEGRKMADAESTVRGALMVARRNAMSPGHSDGGVLFMLDAGGVQQLFIIERQDADQTTAGRLASQNRFVVQDRVFTLPAPIRAVPRYVVDEVSTSQDDQYLAFSPDELANSDFPIPSPPSVIWEEPQRHRNYFSIVFSTEGQLLLNRDVVIHDEHQVSGGSLPTVFYGDRTGMMVSQTTTEYYGRESATGGTPIELDPTGVSYELAWMVTDEPNGVAINFPSVDGVLLYDNSLFAQLETPDDKREALVRTAQPLYVAGSTCAVVRGPIGENEVPE